MTKSLLSIAKLSSASGFIRTIVKRTNELLHGGTIQTVCNCDGCDEVGIECRLYAFGDDGNPSEAFEYFCIDHAYERGYCYICGLFWTGFEAFDFPQYHGVIPGMCPPCSEQTKYDAGELDGQYESDYEYDPYDFVLP